jgi:DNA replicative helicase MCM subunit Mcm2 (Cdc46/Mcm family)
MTGLGVGDVAYKISYKKDDRKEDGNEKDGGYGQKIVIFEVKHGNILIGRFQFEKYCRIISDPKSYFPKAEDVSVIFMMFDQIDTLNKKASYSVYELDNELARKFLEISNFDKIVDMTGSIPEISKI